MNKPIYVQHARQAAHRRRWIHLLTVCIALICISGTTKAQRTPYGKHFFVAIPDTVGISVTTYTNTMKNGAWLFLYSRTLAHVSIKSPGGTKSITVQPMVSSVDTLLTPTSPSPFLGQINTASNDIYEVTSDQPIGIIVYFATTQGTEAFAPLPVERWGTEYFAVGLASTSVNDVRPTGDERVGTLTHAAPGEIVVIASENGTTVTIQATSMVNGTQNRSIQLDAGQAYMIRTAENAAGAYDLSGTHITATKPIGVISGNTRSTGDNSLRVGGFCNIGIDNSTRNSIIEWLPPVGEGGTTFAFTAGFWTVASQPPTDCSPPVDLVRVYATSPGTTVVRDPILGTTRSLTQGSFADFEAVRNWTYRTPFNLVTDKPAQAILVTAPTGDLARDEQATTFGPSMTMLPPHERWIVSGSFHAPEYPTYMNHYIAIAADPSATVYVDGRAITTTPIRSTSPFNNWIIPVSAGDHIIESLNGTFNASAFGRAAGFEWFRPAGTKGGETPTILHPSTYEEAIALSYAYAVPGFDIRPYDSIDVLAPRLGCADSVGYITITNHRAGPLTLTSVVVNDPTRAFTVRLPSVPRTIPPDSTVRIQVTFVGKQPGSKSTAPITVNVKQGTRLFLPFNDTIVWRNVPDTVRVAMPRDYTATPGDTVPTVIELASSLDSAALSSLVLVLHYNTTVIRPELKTERDIDSMLAGTLLEGWIPSVAWDSTGVRITLQAPTPQQILHGTGTLLRPRFTAYVGTCDSTDITFSVERINGSGCLIQENYPGLMRVTICGLSTRLFVFTDAASAMSKNVPNPFSGRTRIDFSLAVEGATRMEIFDASGHTVSVPIDRYLLPGSYSVDVDGSSLNSGFYYYRLSSAGWSKTERMLVVH